MLKKAIVKRNLHDPESNSADLDYWRSRSIEDRLNAVEYLRKQFYGEYSDGLQRVYKIIKQK